MDSREWISRLHSTLYSAIGRANEKMHDRSKGILELVYISNFDPELLPTIMVFGPTSSDCYIESVKKYVELERKIRLFFRPELNFDSEFKQLREMYENGSVHGIRKNTFIESSLDGCIASNNVIRLDHKKLFEVGLTKRELADILKKVKNKLNLPNYDSLDDQINYLNQETEEKLWEKILSAYKLQKIQFTQETSPIFPLEYATYIETSKVLINKFVNKALSFIDEVS